MISYGSQLGTLKRQVIQYITSKTKEPGYKNDPGSLRICQSGAVMAMVGSTILSLEDCSTERLCHIADKIHFRPLGEMPKKELSEKVELIQVKKQEVATNQTIDMGFEIKNNVPLPGQIFTEPVKAKKRPASKQMNYRSLPLKDMNVGDCIIIHECDESTVYSKFASARSGIERFVSLMDTKKKFKVAKTDDHKVGVWRVE